MMELGGGSGDKTGKRVGWTFPKDPSIYLLGHVLLHWRNVNYTSFLGPRMRGKEITRWIECDERCVCGGGVKAREEAGSEGSPSW